VSPAAKTRAEIRAAATRALEAARVVGDHAKLLAQHAACDAARRVCADAVADASARRAAALIAANARYYAALAEIVGER
jgi:hypothetical protein